MNRRGKVKQYCQLEVKNLIIFQAKSFLYRVFKGNGYPTTSGENMQYPHLFDKQDQINQWHQWFHMPCLASEIRGPLPLLTLAAGTARCVKSDDAPHRLFPWIPSIHQWHFGECMDSMAPTQSFITCTDERVVAKPQFGAATNKSKVLSVAWVFRCMSEKKRNIPSMVHLLMVTVDPCWDIKPVNLM